MDTVSIWELWGGVAVRFWPVWLAMLISYLLMQMYRKHLGVFGHLLDSAVGISGLMIVLFWLFTALFADIVSTFEPLEQFFRYRKKPPGIVEAESMIPMYFGSDNLGRDLFSRMVHGSRFVLMIAPAATLVAFVVGITLGLPAGYKGGRVDAILSFIANLILSFPVIVLFYLLVTPGIRETALPNVMAGVFFIFPIIFALMVLKSRFMEHRGVLYSCSTIILLLGCWLYSGVVFDSDPLGWISMDPNELNIFAAVVFASSPGVFRIVRGLTMDIKTRDYVAAAQTRGETPWYIMLWEILPNARGPLIVDACLRIGYTTILLGTLGFFGLGLAPESPDWGSMINQTRGLIRLVPTIVLPQTIALASFVLGLNLLADGLREESLKD
ncbi:MAG: ABC transporter permease [SAR324 cluster bacterium]|jgi:peptide/nickel transport system permease protein|nr:ABC transporter permease [SAR324 cluster bacterium]|tara:strand:+ start:5171 stop:6322 length:1152 start_codon:yes stop_codon:yes gene_type:complete